MLRSTRVRLAVITAAASLSLGVAAGPAAAAGPNQTGLVNVVVIDNTVQIPLGIAANVCDVQVNILAAANVQSPATCTAVAGATATRRGKSGGGGGGSQTGLVNLYVANNTIQVPVGIAANLCDIQANVLAVGNVQGPATCNATGNGTATA